MTRTTFILVLLIAILTAAAGISILLSISNPNAPISAQRKLNAQITPNNTAINLINLLKSDKDQQCALTATIKNIAIKGNIYVSNGSMKGEFKPEYFSDNIRGNFIISKNTLYIWTNIEKDGYKLPLSHQTDLTNNNGLITDLTESMKLSCTPWRYDPQVFEMPKNIIFRDENSSSSPSANTPTKP